MLRLLIPIALFLGLAAPAHAEDPYFPDLAFFPRDRDLNEIVVDLKAVHLRAMKEPSLWKLSQQDLGATAYRFLWLATGQHPISLRLERVGEDYLLHVARHDGPPGLTAGRPDLDRWIKVDAQPAQKIIAQLDASKFWTAPVEVKESRGIGDGDVLLLEGAKGGRYHVITRAGSTAGESYKAFGRSLIELADLPDALRAWDEYRREDRRMPGYRPDPPETEDLGDPGPQEE